MAASKRGKSPKQARAKATVDALVGATGQVFERRGFRKTTTALVAERAGVSVGSLYQYFPDKEALIRAFFDRRIQEDVELMQRVALRAADLRPVQLLRVVTEEMIALYRRDRALYASVAEILPLAEQTPEVRRGLEQAVAMTTALLLANRDLLGDRDPDLVALVMVHSLRSALFRVVELRPDLLDHPSLTDILVGGALGFLGLPLDAR